jgi:hypothetical protein
MPFTSVKLWMVSGFMKVWFNSDSYVRRFFASKSIIITGVYVRKKFSVKKGSFFGYRLFK